MKLLALLLPAMMITLSGTAQDNATKQQCAKQDTIQWMHINFTGFSADQVQKILVKEFSSEGVVADSFYIKPDGKQADNTGSTVGISIKRVFAIHHSYQFLIEGFTPYTLSNITMFLKTTYEKVVNAVYTCQVHSYDLDGVTFGFGNTVEIVKDATHTID